MIKWFGNYQTSIGDSVILCIHSNLSSSLTGYSSPLSETTEKCGPRKAADLLGLRVRINRLNGQWWNREMSVIRNELDTWSVPEMSIRNTYWVAIQLIAPRDDLPRASLNLLHFVFTLLVRSTASGVPPGTPNLELMRVRWNSISERAMKS